MSADQHVVNFALELNVQPAEHSLRQYETAVFRALALAKRLGLPEDMVAAADYVQRQIATLRSLELAYYAVQLARMAAGDPLAWAMAGISVVSAAVSIGDMFEYSMRGR